MNTEREKKLRPKYVVRKILEDGHGGVKLGDVMNSTDPKDVDSPFVLMPRKDPAAFAAMLAYAQCCEQDLAAEIAAWLYTIAEAPPAFGTQGTRNYTATRSAAIEQI